MPKKKDMKKDKRLQITYRSHPSVTDSIIQQPRRTATHSRERKTALQEVSQGRPTQKKNKITLLCSLGDVLTKPSFHVWL